ncbi:hypothetical protein ABZ468_49390 [Streptomyces sp. NPDC005708]|uniref:hypothetical protein n=1 Tax=Streptomyces sp. NPDC005708 TaxID=3154564 RepID=UPI0033D093F1
MIGAKVEQIPLDQPRPLLSADIDRTRTVPPKGEVLGVRGDVRIDPDHGGPASPAPHAQGGIIDRRPCHLQLEGDVPYRLLGRQGLLRDPRAKQEMDQLDEAGLAGTVAAVGVG